MTIERYVEDMDLIQVGARNMQNFELLEGTGTYPETYLIKTGPSATIEEWLDERRIHQRARATRECHPVSVASGL